METTLRGERRFLLSNTSDAAGRSLADFTVDLIFVTTLGASAWQMGLLNTLGSVAFLVATIPIGYLVDRYRPLRLLRIGLAAKLALAGCLLLLTFTGTLSIGYGFLLVTLLGVCNVVAETAQVSAVPQLHTNTGARRATSMSRLIAKLTAADQSLAIIIPVAAGTGFVIFGASTLLAVAVVLAMLALGLAYLVRLPRKPDSHGSQGPGGKEAKHDTHWLSGLKYLRTNRTLIAVTIAVMCSNFGLALGSAVEALFIVNYLGFGAQGFGIFAGLGGAGGLLGAALATRIAVRFSTARLTTATLLSQFFLATMVFIAAFTAPVVSMILLGVQAVAWGIVVIVFNIAVSAWVADITPEQLLGRVSSARRLFTFGAIPLGSLAGGAIGSAFGIPAALGLWSLAVAAGLIGYLVVRPRKALLSAGQTR
ncbi:MFS transporter [Glutamicibacter sp. AOP38-B1-38]|uniref:MFS transporter n=1 Tax=Glutamicibacter sp. AOP38-B1-38 TaxID=3457680 RepID=UPI00403372DE